MISEELLANFILKCGPIIFLFTFNRNIGFMYICLKGFGKIVLRLVFFICVITQLFATILLSAFLFIMYWRVKLQVMQWVKNLTKILL